MKDTNRQVIPGAPVAKCRPLHISFVIVFSVLIGAWWLYEAAHAAIYIMQNNRSWSLFSIYQAAAVCGSLLIVGSLLLLKSSRMSVLPFIAVALASMLRWVLNWQFVFPFGGKNFNLKSINFLELWSTQQFLFALVTLGIAAIVVVHVWRCCSLSERRVTCSQ